MLSIVPDYIRLALPVLTAANRVYSHVETLPLPPPLKLFAQKYCRCSPQTNACKTHSIARNDTLVPQSALSVLPLLMKPSTPTPTPLAPCQAVRIKWAMRDQRVTFFAAREGQAGLSNVFLGGYDPSNFNTTELCAVPPPSFPAAGDASDASGKPAEASTVEGGGILLGVAMGEIELLTDPGQGESQPKTQVLKVETGTVLAPQRQGHSIRAAGSSHAHRKGRRALAVWYYVHSCPDGLFHLCMGFLSGAGWEQLYPPHLGTRKGWTMEHGVPRR